MPLSLPTPNMPGYMVPIPRLHRNEGQNLPVGKGIKQDGIRGEA